jgi:hypothetical protein
LILLLKTLIRKLSVSKRTILFGKTFESRELFKEWWVHEVKKWLRQKTTNDAEYWLCVFAHTLILLHDLIMLHTSKINDSTTRPTILFYLIC